MVGEAAAEQQRGDPQIGESTIGYHVKQTVTLTDIENAGVWGVAV